MYAYDREGSFFSVNQGCYDLSGYTIEELLEMTWAPLVCPDMIEHTRGHVQRALQGEPQRFESAIFHKDGHRVELATTSTPLWMDGNVIGVYSIARDITEKKRAEDALRVSEARFRTMIEQSPLGTQIFSPDGTMLQTNRAWERLWGVTLEQIPQYNPLRDPQLIDKGVMPYIQRGFAGETVEIPPICYEPEVTIAGVTDIPFRWVRAYIYPVKDELGQIREVVLLNEDISEQRRAEESLKEKEQQYRSIFESTTDGVCILASDGRVVEANPAVCAMHGYSYDEFIGIDPMEMTAPECHPKLGEFKAAVRRGSDFRARMVHLRKDGSRFDVDVQGTPILFHGRQHILAVIHDVTDQVRAYELLEQRVTERTRELSTLLDLSHRVSSTLELNPLLAMILEALQDVVDYDSATLLVRDGEHFVGFHHRGPDRYENMLHTLGTDQLRIPVETYGPGWDLFQEGRAVIIEDVRDGTAMAGIWRTIAGPLADGTLGFVRGWMGVPMILKDRLVGLLALSSREPHHYQERHATLALAIAQQAAIAVENAKLYEQAQRWAASEERARLARELHDSVTQALFSMTLHARTTRMHLDRQGIDPNSPLGASVQQLSDLTRGALAEMRTLLFELRPGALREEGLIAAMRKQAAALQAREGLTVTVQAPPERIRLATETEEQLYRLVQEALHNVVKHARAGRISIILSEDVDLVTLEIADDGIGFDPAVKRPGHMGLRTMVERADQIGGFLDIISSPGEGTTIRATVPRIRETGLAGHGVAHPHR